MHPSYNLWGTNNPRNLVYYNWHFCICVFALLYLWFEMHPSYNLWGTNNPRNAQLPTKGGLGLEWILLLSSSIEGKTFPLCCRNMIGTCAFVYFVFVYLCQQTRQARAAQVWILLEIASGEVAGKLIIEFHKVGFHKVYLISNTSVLNS